MERLFYESHRKKLVSNVFFQQDVETLFYFFG